MRKLQPCADKWRRNGTHTPELENRSTAGPATEIA
jgi:hypothetical protein